MKSSPFPESVWPSRRYPFAADIRLNGWALTALGGAILSRALLVRHPEWTPLLRGLVALLPLLPTLAYVHRCARWLDAGDELQRRILTSACLFATVATLLVTTSLSLLGSAGVLAGTRLSHGLGWEGTFAVVVVFLVVGSVLANRRYR